MSLGIVASAHRSGSWTPASLPGLAGWWDANDAATFSFSSGVLVSQWNDKSGNGRHLAQADTAKQPSRNGAMGGVSVVHGASRWLDTAAFTVAQPLSLIVAGIYPTSSGPGMVSSVGGNLQFYRAAAGQIRGYAGGVEISINSYVTGSHVTTLIFNGASSSFRMDGGAPVSGNPGTAGTTTGLRTTERNLAFPTNGYELAEIILCAGALGTTDRAAAEDYLRTKWGTP